MSQKLKLIVGISGASGAIYGVRVLTILRKHNVESHLIISRTALVTLRQEMGITKDLLYKIADITYSIQDIGASIASGSYPTIGMLIAPCSIRTLSEINTGITSSLMSRAADVVLKEERKLVLMVRETLLHLGHLRTMVSLLEVGAVIMPPVPAFYSNPETINNIVDDTLDRALSIFGIINKASVCWSGIIKWYFPEILK